MRYLLKCRIDLCPEEEVFHDVDKINSSDWEKLSRLGIASRSDSEETTYEHLGYCPSHSL